MEKIQKVDVDRQEVTSENQKLIEQKIEKFQLKEMTSDLVKEEIV